MEAAETSPRRRDSVATKARILAAAKQCFAQVGYAGTGIRDIAARAGVSYTLLGRYYGSKAGLLEAALVDSIGIAPVMAAERSGFGENLARLITQSLDDMQPIAMTILSAADPDARLIATRVVDALVVEPLAAWIGAPHARERAVAITMLGGGFVIYSRQLPLLGGPVGMDHPSARWLARSVQDVVDRTEGWDGAATVLPGVAGGRAPC
ncbi:TetR family transcriptional regulator [Sphingobium sufflavum]|uniref:TetR/AcrR family transcriptional regulator n=1 Tax=Sphingobium sufflavum TaxID=1129547 RepID=UPI001F22051A|nr:TetR/AcrR family transcriptional regulator [Sphingobium sufflavum]MCE7796676.1 TetR family transcriptional regulator [Sphingobium sufflavum]